MINKSPTEQLVGILWISQEPMVGPKWDGSAGEIASYVIDVAMERPHLWDDGNPKTSKPPYS